MIKWAIGTALTIYSVYSVNVTSCYYYAFLSTQNIHKQHANKMVNKLNSAVITKVLQCARYGAPYFIYIISLIIITTVRERFSHSLPPHFTDMETEVQRMWCDYLNCSLRFFYLLLSQAAKTWQLAATPLPLDLIGLENGEDSLVFQLCLHCWEMGNRGSGTPLEVMAETVEAGLSTPFQGSGVSQCYSAHLELFLKLLWTRF